MQTERQLYESGYSVREIAAMRGWGLSRTLDRLRWQGFTPRPTGRQPLGSDDEKVKIAKGMREHGLTFRQIARAMDVSPSQAHKYVARAGG